MTAGLGRSHCDGFATPEFGAVSFRWRILVPARKQASPRRTPERIPAARGTPRERGAVPDPHHLGLLCGDLSLGPPASCWRYESFPASSIERGPPCLLAFRGCGNQDTAGSFAVTRVPHRGSPGQD